MGDILKIVDQMDPETALTEIGDALNKLFSTMDGDASTRFLMNLLGDSGEDKISGMVHL
ncbi:MAG: hypothetical protein WC799_10875 [Desulfobacteraceae bacterium]|jgi:hypothetical protein